MISKDTLSQTASDNPTLRPDEIEKFDRLAKEWWDENGKMKSALSFNKARLTYIKSQICQHFERPTDEVNALSGLSLLDVGSGGGLLSEPLAQSGASVTGIDASAVSVEVARRHAIMTNTSNVHYEHALSKDLVERGKTYDIVINAEVVEHVNDQATLIKECIALVKPGGLFVVATLNKTIKSFFIAIVGAEYVMRYLPIGTHSWSFFVKPNTLKAWAYNHKCSLTNETGMALNPLTGQWRYTTDMSVNYCLCFSKPPRVE
jgi:2-polyprenyl-6-hydroxyphenyl methylase/3-demethylubiquinone-9 3-methyltransferase